jgi:LCP family protein required for cell wall assembly
MNDDLRSRKRVNSIDGFVVRPKSSRYDKYRPLHQVQSHQYVDPNRLRHNHAAAQPQSHGRPIAPKAAEVTKPPRSDSPVAAHPLQSAIENSKPLADRYRQRKRLPQTGNSPAEPLSKPKKKKRSLKHWLTTWNRKKIIKVSIITILLIILISGGWLGWKLYRNAAKITHNNNPFNLLSAFKPVPLKNQNGQVNILLAGNSADDPGHDGANLTDSIMIMTINTKTKQASMLSIPRDLWVEVPTMGHQKINAANTIANFSAAGYPSGGMGALEQVITENMGITIDYYALINYSAFRDAVNAVGGITVNIQSPDPRGLYDPNISKADKGPLKLPNGSVTLDGQTALNLARARGDSYYSYGFPQSDFDRTQHQRQMLLAIKDKATSANVLANPLKVGKLADALGNNIKTDMKIDEIETFYSYTKGITDTNTLSYNLNDLTKGVTMLKNYTAPNGQSALIPAAGLDDFSDIKVALNKLFSSDPLIKEGAQVVVLNGGGVDGLASKESKALTDKNITVAAVADAPKTYPTTEIIDNSKGTMPNTKQALQKMFGTNIVASDPSIKGYTADFIIILGQNQQPPSSNTTSSGH